jgi:hypothetical protein
VVGDNGDAVEEVLDKKAAVMLEHGSQANRED